LSCQIKSQARIIHNPKCKWWTCNKIPRLRVGLRKFLVPSFLVPELCLGTDCSRGSASRRNASETRMLDESAGRACKSVSRQVLGTCRTGLFLAYEPCSPGGTRPPGSLTEQNLPKQKLQQYQFFKADMCSRQVQPTGSRQVPGT